MSERARGFESHSLRFEKQCFSKEQLHKSFIQAWRSTQEAEGTPLERVQVVNSGARVQIPPSPFDLTNARSDNKKRFEKSKKVVDKQNDMWYI